MALLKLNQILELVTTEGSDSENEDNCQTVESVIDFDRKDKNCDLGAVSLDDIKILEADEILEDENEVQSSEGSILDKDDTDDYNPTPTEDDSSEGKEDYQPASTSTGTKVTENRSRKRKRNPTDWLKNKRKQRRQSGSNYKNVRGREIPKRNVEKKKDCVGKCKYRCELKITKEEKENIFKSFWSLNDSEKNHFYSKTVEKNEKKRKRTKSENSRKKFSYSYHLLVDENKIRVCKEFYLSTLSISQRRISYYFDKKHDPTTSVPKHGDRRGKSTQDRIPVEDKQFVRDHISSFPTVESHYCRAGTSKQYLDQSLSIAQMYRLYLEKCETSNKNPVKDYLYRQIFNTDFNLDFHSPKKDRCDKCEEYTMKEKFDLLDDSIKDSHSSHVRSKIATKAERNFDRQSNEVVVCFDLQNVITCPRANISSFFYRRKLSVYNLTAHCSVDPSYYTAIWHEGMAGRGANEISSALVMILEDIVKKHNPKKLILWSDSCVGQNRNSVVSFALKTFLKTHDVEEIVQKFCEPGHSSIQEVDFIHSLIERQLKITEVFSPLAVMKCLKKASSKPINIIQMRPDMFTKYKQAALLFKFVNVPYTKVKYLKYTKDQPFAVTYQTSFSEPAESSIISIRPREHFRLENPTTMFRWPKIKPIIIKPVLSKEKISDIKAMLKFMPPTDKLYMSKLINQ